MQHPVMLFKILPIAAAALLAACGGGSDSVAPTLTPTPASEPPPVLSPPAVTAPPVPWASPAMIVPLGDASKTIPLTACNNGMTNSNLVVNSAGDMIVSGAAAGTTTVSEISRINYAAATSQRVESENTSDGPRTRVELRTATDRISVQLLNPGSFRVFTSTYSCAMTNGSSSFALITLPSSSRMASELLSGITGMVNTGVASGSFTGGVAFWDNWAVGRVDNPLTTDEAMRYVSFNINSGALGTSPAPNMVGTSYNITPPTTPMPTRAFFRESISSGIKTFYSYADTPTSGRFFLCFGREGNLFKPEHGDFCD